jgi:transketolase
LKKRKVKVDETSLKEFEKIAREVRILILKSLAKAGSGHTGGSLSAVEILVSLYFKEMNIDVNDPSNPDRDRFVLSKGHGAPALYAVLAKKGFFPESALWTLRKLIPQPESPRGYVPSILQGHPDRKKTPGLEASTGSLGQGLSIGIGMALAGKISKRNYRVYVLMGDGELQEGEIWEAAMSASHFKLDNLCGIVDNNGLQIDGPVSSVMEIQPLADKFRAFGWNVLEIDGHSFKEIFSAFEKARNLKGSPTVIIAKTVKGKGVSIFENKVKYHGVAPTEEELKIALRELGEDAV